MPMTSSMAYYEPSLGRWLNVDPDAEKYQSWNAYQYTFNAPLTYIDPDGRGPWLWMRLGLKAIGMGNRASKVVRTVAILNRINRIARASSFQQALQVVSASNRVKTLLTVGNVGLGASLANEIFTVPDIDFRTYEIFPSLPDGTLVMPRGVDALPPVDAVLTLDPPIVEPFVEGIDTRVPEIPSILYTSVWTHMSDPNFRALVEDYAEIGIFIRTSRKIGIPSFSPESSGSILIPQGRVMPLEVLKQILEDMHAQIAETDYQIDANAYIQELLERGEDDLAEIYMKAIESQRSNKN